MPRMSFKRRPRGRSDTRVPSAQSSAASDASTIPDAILARIADDCYPLVLVGKGMAWSSAEDEVRFIEPT